MGYIPGGRVILVILNFVCHEQLSIMYHRKICQNCLCPREEHDIREEPEGNNAIPVGKLLFAASADTLTRGDKHGSSPAG